MSNIVKMLELAPQDQRALLTPYGFQVCRFTSDGERVETDSDEDLEQSAQYNLAATSPVVAEAKVPDVIPPVVITQDVAQPVAGKRKADDGAGTVHITSNAQMMEWIAQRDAAIKVARAALDNLQMESRNALQRFMASGDVALPLPSKLFD